MEFFPETLSPEESADSYKRINAFMEQKGFGLFAAEEKETQEYIGFIGFNQPAFSSDFTPCIEIGWRLHRRFWNRGFATEGAKAVSECVVAARRGRRAAQDGGGHRGGRTLPLVPGDVDGPEPLLGMAEEVEELVHPRRPEDRRRRRAAWPSARSR